MTSKIFFVSLFLIPAMVIGCSNKDQPASTPKDALQKYLDCLFQKDVSCVYKLMPDLTKTTAEETFRNLKTVRGQVRDKDKLLCLAKRSGLNTKLLDAKSGKDVIAYALNLKNRKLTGIVGGMQNTVKTIRKVRGGYVGKTYAGFSYTIIRTKQGNFQVRPIDVVIRRLNRAGAAAVLMLRKSKTPSPCKSKK